MNHLAVVHRAGLLDAEAFVDTCGPALTGPKKAATTTIRVLLAIADAAGRGSVPGRSADVDTIVEALTGALGHPHADVQRAAVKALAKLGREDLARQHREWLTPAVATELLPQPIVPPRRGVPDGDPDAPSPGVPQAEPVAPWSDGEAVERCAALLEDGANAIEFELLLAWLATTDRAATVLEPLAKRARQVAGNHEDGTGASWVAALVSTALDPAVEFLPRRFRQWYRTRSTGDVREPVGDPEPEPSAEELTDLPNLVARARGVAAILAGRVPRRQLLATPTDTHGRLDADILLDRWRHQPAAALTAPGGPSSLVDEVDADLFLSMRPEALERAQRAPTREHPMVTTDADAFQADLNQAILRVPPADRDRVVAATGAAPVLAEKLQIHWHHWESTSRRPNGAPAYVWWTPHVRHEHESDPSPLHPGLPTTWQESADSFYVRSRQANDLVVGALGLVDPATTAPLVPIGVWTMNNAMEVVNHQAGPILRTLAAHPGTWTSQTAQVIALGMASKRAEYRAHTAEILVAAIPGRIDAAAMARGFADCAPAVTLTRWAGSLADAATLASAPVVDLLTALLPRLDRSARGVGALVTLLLDESLRIGATPTTTTALRDWLTGFKGASAAARSARALLALTPA